MTTFTVFFCGTGASHEDHQNPAYIDGELIAKLARNHPGLEFDDWIIVDGPGSGNLQEADKWVRPGNYCGPMGIGFGYGWEENVAHAIAVIKKDPKWYRKSYTEKDKKALSSQFEQGLLDENSVRKITPQHLQLARARIMKIPLPTVVNLVGWSRGAVTCHMMANAMAQDEQLKGVTVNIFAIDPVPGPLQFQPHRVALGPNVQDYFGVFARDERSFGFTPTLPKLSVRGSYLTVILPGRHGTLVGNAHADGQRQGPQTFTAPGRLVRHFAELFLNCHGVTMTNCLNLSSYQQLKLYDEMVLLDAGYQAMQRHSYTKLPDSLGKTRPIAQGHASTNTPLAKVTALESPGGFINTHHEYLWNRVIGGRDFSKLSLEQKKLLSSFPCTARRVVTNKAAL
ncbi:hypothetical protein [Massilia sp. YMA4]|uniref:hypothetical protein n=1 Tax=Massilia sp. YMA4 TaxID=1593482 RepID=UPI000DD122D2|nr:hypothetical protein [Massilia sp. YMA4]AXA90525.1 hypothetical protein DPH57_04655 [Massilia sp. YMA4]